MNPQDKKRLEQKKMAGELVFSLVWHCAIHPTYIKRKHASELNNLICNSNALHTLFLAFTRKHYKVSLSRVMKVLEYLADEIFVAYNFPRCTRKHSVHRDSPHYKLRALDLAVPHIPRNYDELSTACGYPTGTFTSKF
jgi:hypothetical protein